MFFPYDDRFILYNSASGNLILTNTAEINLENISSEDTSALAAMGFIVDEDADELHSLITAAETHIESSKKNKFRILTTTACNAKCPYCYEKGTSVESMNLHTAEKVADFIADVSKHKKIVEIEWFGGEPLLNTEVINSITERLKTAGLRLESSIITNGYLINDALIDSMRKKWNTKRVQITLDGLADEYEKVKRLGKDSFGKVIDNIRRLCNNDISVDVRLNFSAGNISQIEEVIKFLSKCDFRDKIYVYAAKINSEKKTDKFLLEEETLYLNNVLYECKFLSPDNVLPKTLKSPCAACRVDYYTIHPSGRLYKCDRKLLSGSAVGDVEEYDLETLKAKTESWLGVKIEERCKKCSMLPLCWNGCIYDRLNNLDRCYLTANIIGQRLRFFVKETVERIVLNGRQIERRH